jgi:hypothetical protein
MATRPYKGDDKVFVKACELAGLKPSHKQHAKYQKGKGVAHGRRVEAAGQVAEARQK